MRLMRMVKFVVGLLLASTAVFAQPKNILYVTHSAGFRHDSLPVSQQVLRDLGARTGQFNVVATEDLSAFDDLSRYSAIVLFTSGELPLSPAQKQSLLDFVRKGGGFAGFHSATDTLYTWPEYGELIGARFDGHPWVQQVPINIEDPEHPTVRHLSPQFSITDEIYQFREFSRGRVRVLMTLDTTSVDMSASGVNRTDDDFALAWIRSYGDGRVFYSALGHFDSTWQDPRFQQMVEAALLWITRLIPEGDAEPRPAVSTTIAPNGIGNAATLQPAMTVSAGSFVSIFGANLTTGATMASDVREPAYRLAGTRVRLNDKPAPMVFASPGQINLLIPTDVSSRTCGEKRCINVKVQAAGSPERSEEVTLAATTPGIFGETVGDGFVTLWCTGLGPVERRGSLDWTTATPRVTLNGNEVRTIFSGLAPGWPGLYQVNVELPSGATQPFTFALTME